MEGDVSRTRFRWALVLTWAPWVAMLPGFWTLFIGFNNSKATGVAAVVGGVAEALVWWGLATLVVAQLVALIWLLRSFSKEDIFRNLISVISIFASGMMLLFVAGFFWLEHYITHLQTAPPR